MLSLYSNHIHNTHGSSRTIMLPLPNIKRAKNTIDLIRITGETNDDKDKTYITGLSDRTKRDNSNQFES